MSTSLIFKARSYGIGLELPPHNNKVMLALTAMLTLIFVPLYITTASSSVLCLGSPKHVLNE